MSSPTLRVDIKGDTSGLDTALKKSKSAANAAGTDIKRSLDKVDKSFKSASKGADNFSKHTSDLMTSLKGLATVAFAAVIVKQFSDIAAASVQLASNMEETQGKFNVVFRGMTDQAEDWSTTLRKSYNIAGEESKRFLSSIQDLLVPTGMAREEAGAMSNKFVKLAADLASFNNLPTAKVIEDIQSALQGGSETMAKYGVNVKQAKVQQEVFALGLAKTKAEITDAHKAQAILSISYRESADAVGDAMRTSESYANQTKKQANNINELKVAFGQGLLPALTDAKQAFNEWYEVNGELLAQDLKAWAEGIGTAISAVATAAGVAAEALGWFIDGYRELEKDEAAEALRATRTELEGLKESLEILENASLGTKVFAQISGETVDQKIIKTKAQIGELESAIQRILDMDSMSSSGLMDIDDDLEGWSASLKKASAEAEKNATAVKKNTAEICASNKKKLTCAQKEAEERVKVAKKAAAEESKLHEQYQKAAEGYTDNWAIQLKEQNDTQSKYQQERGNAVRASLQKEVKLHEDASNDIVTIQSGMTGEIAGVMDEWVDGVLTGQVEGLGEMFGTQFEGILDSFVNMVTSMVSEWAKSGIMGMLSGEGFGGFSMDAFSGLKDAFSSLGKGLGLLDEATGGGGGGLGGGGMLGMAATVGKKIAGYLGLQTGGAAGGGGGSMGLAGTIGKKVAGYLGLGKTGVAGTTQQLGQMTKAVEAGMAAAGTTTAISSATTAAAQALIASEGVGWGATVAAQGAAGTVAGTAAGASAGMGAAAGSLLAGAGMATAHIAVFKAMEAFAGLFGGPGSHMAQGVYESESGNQLELFSVEEKLADAIANLSDPAWIKTQLDNVQTSGANLIGDMGSVYGGDAHTGFTDTISGIFDAMDEDLHEIEGSTENGGLAADAMRESIGSLGDKFADVYTSLEIESEQFGDGMATLALGMADSVGSFDAFVDASAGYDVAMGDSAAMMDMASSAAHGNAASYDQLVASLQGVGMSTDQAASAANQMMAVMANSEKEFSKTKWEMDAEANIDVDVRVEATGTDVDVRADASADAGAGGFGQYKLGGAVGEGGLLSGGSGIVDDLYLGMVNGKHIVAQGGEFIMNQKATAKHLTDLKRWNSETFATGGSVGGGAGDVWTRGSTTPGTVLNQKDNWKTFWVWMEEQMQRTASSAAKDMGSSLVSAFRSAGENSMFIEIEIINEKYAELIKKAKAHAVSEETLAVIRRGHLEELANVSNQKDKDRLAVKLKIAKQLDNTEWAGRISAMEVSYQYDEMRKALERSGGTAEELTYLEKARTLAMKEATKEALEALKNIRDELGDFMETFDDIIAKEGMDDYQKQIYDLNKRYKKAVEEAKKLEATEADLAKIEKARLIELKKLSELDSKTGFTNLAEVLQEIKDFNLQNQVTGNRTVNHASGGIALASHYIGEAGAEAILPLRSPKQINNIEDKMDALLHSAGGDTKVTVYIGNEKLDSHIAVVADDVSHLRQQRGVQGRMLYGKVN